MSSPQWTSFQIAVPFRNSVLPDEVSIFLDEDYYDCYSWTIEFQ